MVGQAPARSPRGHGARCRHRWERECRWREMGAAVTDEVGGARRRRGPATEDAGREKELSPPLPIGERVAVHRSNIEEVAPSVGEGMAARRRLGTDGRHRWCKRAWCPPPPLQRAGGSRATTAGGRLRAGQAVRCRRGQRLGWRRHVREGGRRFPHSPGNRSIRI